MSSAKASAGTEQPHLSAIQYNNLFLYNSNKQNNSITIIQTQFHFRLKKKKKNNNNNKKQTSKWGDLSFTNITYNLQFTYIYKNKHYMIIIPQDTIGEPDHVLKR
jgi:hypothetical protein